VQANGIPPHVAVMHALPRCGPGDARLAVARARFVDEMEARMNTIFDARAIGGGGHSEARLVELIRQGTL
jgi:hypothetical protein